ncbi:F0F1 ATP synthase subunit alpha [Candidatus Fermentibacteria bacterium]|nr:F0F1 ATP synthase subunit alpha [Candidatus Fermentibacteria bacterium]
MPFRPEEVSAVLRRELEAHRDSIDIAEAGAVLQVGDGIARIWGLEAAMAGELVSLPNDVTGMVFNLEEDNVGVVLFGGDELVKEGDPARRTGTIARVPVGNGLLGRVIDPLGRPLDGKGPIVAEYFNPIERPAPGVVDRRPVCEPVQTGIKAVDALVPIGRGQRELLIGDRGTGKTALAVDTIINQKGKDLVCIYVAIGQKESSVARVKSVLEEHGAMDHTVIVAATASVPAPLQYIAPYAGTAAGEYFRDGGRHALCVFDDLSKHAVAYRQISLLLRRPPGREAYPGDVFYLHSRLLERAARLSESLGGGSLTALPIIETQAGDVSAYIPTNVISITDGQIYLESDLFHSGVRPAINAGLSVSRVGGKAQAPAMKKVSSMLRLDMAQYRELAAFTQFGGDLDPDTRRRLARGERVVEVLKQDQYSPMPLEHEVAVIFAAVNGHLDAIPAQETGRFERRLLAFLDREHVEIMHTIGSTRDLDDGTAAALQDAVSRFVLSLQGGLAS